MDSVHRIFLVVFDNLPDGLGFSKGHLRTITNYKYVVYPFLSNFCASKLCVTDRKQVGNESQVVRIG